jgi:MFS transporter, UMF1 family
MTAEGGGAPGAAAEPVSDPAARRREQRGWYFYDWAFSAFSTTVVTVFLGPYLTDVTEAAAGADGFVRPLGIPVRAESFFPYAVALSVALQVLVLPMAGAIADRTRRKKEMLAAFAYLGALATMGMYFLDGSNYLLGGLLLVIANVAYGASAVIYYSFLPDIALPDERDAVSSRGWGLGYLGGALLLVANLGLFLGHETVGVSEAEAVRISLLSAGVWWAAWTLVPLRLLRGRQAAGRGDGTGGRGGIEEPGARLLTGGFRQLRETMRSARAYPTTLLFLVGYLLYNDGIQTVVALAATYGDEELGLGQTTLISAILLVQVVGFGGAVLSGKIAERAGARRTVLGCLVLWTVAVTLGYFLAAGDATQFYLLAALIGLVLGGSQALSRSLFSHLIPRGQEAEYFSLYEVTDRGTSWLGTLIFGLVLQWAGSYRSAIISLIVFFVAGFVVLLRVDIGKGVIEAGNVPPARI